MSTRNNDNPRTLAKWSLGILASLILALITGFASLALGNRSDIADNAERISAGEIHMRYLIEGQHEIKALIKEQHQRSPAP